MKRFFSMILTISLLTFAPAFGLNAEESEHLRDMRVQPNEPVNAPRWTDYVPSKYENPRTDFKRRSATTELIWGVVLTDLLITSPIGIPMICHGSTKLKNVSYAEKKKIFFDGLEQAKNVPEAEQTEFYNQLIKQCKFKKKYID